MTMKLCVFDFIFFSDVPYLKCTKILKAFLNRRRIFIMANQNNNQNNNQQQKASPKNLNIVTLEGRLAADANLKPAQEGWQWGISLLL